MVAHRSVVHTNLLERQVGDVSAAVEFIEERTEAKFVEMFGVDADRKDRTGCAQSGEFSDWLWAEMAVGDMAHNLVVNSPSHDINFTFKQSKLMVGPRNVNPCTCKLTQVRGRFELSGAELVFVNRRRCCFSYTQGSSLHDQKEG